MFLVVQRKTIALLLLLPALLGAAIGLYQTDTPALFTQSPDGWVVVLDAGHGGMDGGAVGTTGVLEKELNLAVTKQIEALLLQQGVQVILTRSEDISLHQNDKASVHAQKESDLKTRWEIGQKSNADLFVSIHMNQFSQSQYRGAQVFYADSPHSKELAQMLKQQLDPVSEKSKNRQTKAASDSMYILRKAKIPSVLVECGFLSNPEEEALLCSPEYQQQIAQAITDALLRFRDYQTQTQ